MGPTLAGGAGDDRTRARVRRAAERENLILDWDLGYEEAPAS
jgi:hypothetical protein